MESWWINTPVFSPLGWESSEIYSTLVTQTLLHIGSPGEYNFFLMPRPPPKPIKCKSLWVGLRHMLVIKLPSDCSVQPSCEPTVHIIVAQQEWTWVSWCGTLLVNTPDLRFLPFSVSLPHLPPRTSWDLLLINFYYWGLVLAKVCFFGYQRKLGSGEVKHLAESLTARTWQS